MGFLAGKRYLIVGVASDRSIATGIAEAMHREGAELAFTFQNEKLKSRVVKAAERYGSSEALCYPCDVASDEEIEAVFTSLGNWMALSMRWALPPAMSWMATLPTWPPGKASVSPMIFPATASLPWPRPAAR